MVVVEEEDKVVEEAEVLKETEELGMFVVVVVGMQGRGCVGEGDVVSKVFRVVGWLRTALFLLAPPTGGAPIKGGVTEA